MKEMKDSIKVMSQGLLI